MNTTTPANEPPMLTNPRAIIQDVGRWAESQPWHPKHAPDWGIGEEIGELLHGILKNFQGIRGFDDPVKFRDHTIDALGDTMVYLSHWCFLHNTYYYVGDARTLPPGWDIRQAFSRIYTQLAHMFILWQPSTSDTQMHMLVVGRLVATLQEIATAKGYDLILDCLAPTWHKVRLRNWNKSRLNGGDPEIMAKQDKTEPRISATEAHTKDTAVAFLRETGNMVIPAEWLSARGYTPDDFAAILAKGFPANETERLASGGK